MYKIKVKYITKNDGCMRGMMPVGEMREGKIK